VKNFTITTAGRLNECLLLAYRTPADRVRHLLPRGLELLTRDGFAFWNVVAATVEDMRPAVFPPSCGVSYHHVAYRLYVQGRAEGQAEPVRGLYFVRSDADSAVVGRLGNVFSAFHFHPAEVEISSGHSVLTVSVRGGEAEPDARCGEPGGAPGDAIVRVAADGVPVEAALAHGSPFASVADAERFLKYPPLGLSVDLDGRFLKLAEAIRDESKWAETPVRVIESRLRFFATLGLAPRDVALERATRVAPIDYRWRLGKRMPLSTTAPVAPVPETKTVTPQRPSRAAA
jgi:hypothetical protein